jgi:hypothetical protein
VHSVRPLHPVGNFSFPPQPCYVLIDLSTDDTFSGGQQCFTTALFPTTA